MPEPFLLGASLALTGPEALYAREILHALEIALEDEGRTDVTPQVEDDASEIATARQAAMRLAANPRVLAVIGPMNSWTAEVQAPIYFEAKLAHLTPSASNPALGAAGWTTFFRMCPNDAHQGRVLARVAREYAGARTVAALHDGTSFGAPVARIFLEECERLGLTSSGTWLIDELDKVAGRQPDALFIVGLEEPCRQAALALRRAGVRSVFLGTDAIKPTATRVTPGHDVPGPYLTNAGTDARHRASEFHRRFEARAGAHHSIYTVEAYDAARLCLTALRAGVDRGSMRASIARTEHEGLSRRVRFDPQGERLGAAIGVYRYVGESLEFIGVERL